MRRAQISGAIAALVFAGCSSDISGPAQTTTALLAPGNLAGAALPGGTQVRLTWTDRSIGESGFRVDVSNVPIVTTADVTWYAVAPANATSYTYGTAPGTTRYYRVLAVTGTLESDPSSVIVVTTPNVPLAPAGLSAAGVSMSSVNLNWTDTYGESGYRVERSGDGGATWVTAASLPAESTTCLDTGLAAETEYCYRVFAVNGDGDSLPSNTACARTASGGVVMSTAYEPGDVGRHTSIAVDPGGKVHISHYDATNVKVLYSTDAGGTNPDGTFPTVVADGGPTGYEMVGSDGTSIAVDPSGFVHLAAHDLTNDDLRYITNQSGLLVATTIDAGGFVGKCPKIAVSPADGSIHIVYVTDLPGPDALRRAVYSGGGWTFETFTPQVYLGEFSFALDAAGRPHVSYAHSPDGVNVELVYGERPAGSWVFTVVPASGTPHFNSIAIDPAGLPHIVYFDSLNSDLHHATRSSGIWTSETVHHDPTRTVGRYCSLAIDPSSGRLHVVYFDTTQQDLRYARKDPGASWVLQLLDTTGDVGRYCDVGIGAGGALQASYYDAATGNLKYLTGSP
jgi:hypothetical protein